MAFFGLGTGHKTGVQWPGLQPEVATGLAPNLGTAGTLDLGSQPQVHQEATCRELPLWWRLMLALLCMRAWGYTEFSKSVLAHSGSAGVHAHVQTVYRPMPSSPRPVLPAVAQWERKLCVLTAQTGAEFPKASLACSGSAEA